MPHTTMVASARPKPFELPVNRVIVRAIASKRRPRPRSPIPVIALTSTGEASMAAGRSVSGDMSWTVSRRRVNVDFLRSPF